ncbi:sensor histidine kinase [Dictyobacter arantiisoli]|uniref:histidine kinase n=1 Tax=Dictyobacter arantiisoli TaxID=2014874 RepID=A0A5A5TER8_9CHLR|nr:ATP-binding protein [Dictyobacter arantiisoli]GCF10061.1 hypothetical protein KDI_36250 [Dictyobacter arantiisoli]
MINPLLQLAQSKQTYQTILYHLLAFPLGLLYFIMLLLGLCLGMLDLVIIGLPLTVLFFWLWWKFGSWERSLSIHWLKADIAPMAAPLPADRHWVQRILLHLRRSVTWKSLGYLSLKFPFGLLSFVLTLVIIILIFVLIIVLSVLALLITPFGILFTLAFTKKKLTRKFFFAICTGGGIPFALLYVIVGLGTLWSYFARASLGMSDQAMRLAQAVEIAEKEHARAELADKLRRDLIVNVSHELRTPIASIRGHIDALLLEFDASAETLPSMETVRTYLEIVQRESVSLGTLVNDLLSVARAETHELRVDLTEVQAGNVVEEVYQALMPLAKRERQVSVIRDIAPHLPAVQVDRQRLLQILLNLVRNAITYTPDGGIVSISLQPANQRYIVLSIADTGVGMAPEELEHIFERFYRTDTSRARHSGGFGLGLAIVHDFVLAMGGSISVDSVVGEGSCFRVLLPIYHEVSTHV